MILESVGVKSVRLPACRPLALSRCWQVVSRRLLTDAPLGFMSFSCLTSKAISHLYQQLDQEFAFSIHLQALFPANGLSRRWPQGVNSVKESNTFRIV